MNDFDPEVRRMADQVCRDIQHRQFVPEKLEAVTAGMAAIERYTADHVALDYARDRLGQWAVRWGVNPDLVQAALAEGSIHRNRERAPRKQNGKANGAPANGVGQGPKGLEEPKSPPPSSATLESAVASKYKMRAVRWFWPNRFALGKLGLLGGLPDRGKGLLTADIIARATNGDPWPCNEGQAIKGNALLLTAEDDIEDTVVPRLVGAGADLDRVHIIKMVSHREGKRMFNLVTDLELLREKIKAIGSVVLVVIDPMSAYLGVGQIDNYRTSDVRGVLGPLKELAEESMISILGIMHFNKKADVHNAMLRIADSLAYVAAARHCYVVVDDVENSRRLFVKAKNNLAPDMAALSYTTSIKKVGIDPETGAPIISPHVIWGADHVNVTAIEAMQAEEKGSTKRPRDGAKEFLTSLLAMGPLPQQDVEEAAEANLIAKATLKRAKEDLKIKPRKDGLKGPWLWELPKHHE